MGYIPIVAVTLVFLMMLSDSKVKPQTQPGSGCGSYSAISHMIAVDRVADGSHLVLSEHGGVAALHDSTTELNGRTAKCGAVLITDRFLLTAAHCMLPSEGLISISLGRENLDLKTNPGPNSYQIVEKHLHPQYNRSRNRYNDIAVIKTDRKVKFTKSIWPYCLPERNQVFDDYTPMEISGYGFVNQTHRTPVLRNRFVYLVENSRCRELWQHYGGYDTLQHFSYPQGFTNQLACAGRRGVDACNGDSGGPLSHRNKKGLQTVIGLVARGVPVCAEVPVLPGLYTNVVEYLDWIQGIQQSSSPTSSPPQTLPSRPAATGSLVPVNGGSVEPAASNQCGIRKLHPQNNNPKEAGFGEFPWMARIVIQDGVADLGALISSNWILTAASSVQGRSPESLKVHVGVLYWETALNEFYEEVHVDQIIIHPQYNVQRVSEGYRSWHYNIALLRLGTSLNRDGRPHIAPVCLPSQGETFTGLRCWVSGWGRATGTGFNGQSVLQKESLPIWEPLECERQLRKSPSLPQNFTLDKSSSICAGGEAGKNTCVGAGAPMVCQGSNGRYMLVGLASWYVGFEETCVTAINPYVYSNIPHMIDFIKQHTGN